jgi:hypothetical protein
VARRWHYGFKGYKRPRTLCHGSHASLNRGFSGNGLNDQFCSSNAWIFDTEYQVATHGVMREPPTLSPIDIAKPLAVPVNDWP